MIRRRRQRPRRRALRFADLLIALGLLGLLALVTDRVQRSATQYLSGAVRVHDGDTLTVDGTRIRLKGLDAPEYAQTCSRNGETYACGRRARDMLRRLVASGQVACEGHERDRYDRLLARCTVGDEDVGEALVAAGWAIAYGDYDRVEAEARRARRGLWSGAFDAPRDWRATHGSTAPEEEDGGLLARLIALLRRTIQ